MSEGRDDSAGRPADPSQAPTCYRHTDRESWIRCQRCDRPICPDCMREAAVGFQCPDCVSEGARATRQWRTAYGGRRSGNPALTSLVLIAANVGVWLAIVLTGGYGSRLVSLLAISPDGVCLAADRASYFPNIGEQVCRANPSWTWTEGVASGWWWQVITNAFTHVEIWHIGFNMLVLWFLGPQLEAVLGRARFLALYLGSALAASAFVMLLSNPAGSTLGASGAIFGLMGALLLVAWKVGGNYQQILVWLGINVVITVVGSSFISWQGHLGGFVGGVAIAAALVLAPRERRTAVQVAGVSAVVVASLAAIALRALALA